jgi:Ca2+-binding RTX toxin-like protein
VTGDTNGSADIFIKDLVTGAIERVSRDAAGLQGNSESDSPVFSPDGTKIGFRSFASNLVAGDTNSSWDVFFVTLGPVDVLTGGAGNDTYIVHDFGDSVTELAAEGNDTVQSSISYTLGANLENLVLSGASAINGTGNTLNNLVTGNSGNNTLDGVAGNDTLTGGLGDDTYVVDTAGDVVTENASEGTDTVQSSLSWTLGSNLENLVLTGSAAINGTGNTLNNTVTGNSGNNTLDGGAGDDTLTGGLGNDTYVVDAAGDVVTENALEGTDIVQSSITWTLGSNIETLTLTGSAAINGTGNTLNNTLTGNSANNTLDGEAGNDTLDGGAGDDTLTGGSGLDTAVYSGLQSQYVVSSPASGGLSVSGPDGTDFLNGIETLRFSDATVTVNYASAPAEFRVNTYTANNQYSPSVTALSDGGWVVTWESFGQDGSEAGIYGQRYTSAGLASGSEFRVNTYTTWSQSQPSVTALSDGGWVVTWTSNAQDDGDFWNHGGIYGQRYTSAGLASGAEFRVNSYTTNNQFGSSVTALSDGGWVVTWTSNGQDGSDRGVYGQRYSAAGLASGPEFRVNADTTGSQVSQSVAALSDGGWVVTWSSNGNERGVIGLGPFSDIYGQRYDSAGLASGAGFRINTDTLAGAIASSVTALADGGWVVTWLFSVPGYLAQTMIYGQRYTSTGVASGPQFQINPHSNTGLISPAITALSDGGWVVTWDTYLEGNGTGVYGQRYNAAGLASGPEFRIDTYSGGSQISPSVAALSQGGWVVTWSSNGQDGSSSGIYSQRYSADGVPLSMLSSLAIIGDASSQTLVGSAGNDTLDGGSGSDTLIGGLGDDTYVVDAPGDVVTENASEGTDTVQSSVSYTLGSNLENLTLTGSAAINGTGNSLANSLTGNSGNNTLDGGAGNDTLIGGLGDDTYVVDAPGDVVTENASEGADTVQSSFSYTLGANLEKLALTGSAAINGTGNSLANTITGNSGNNTLDGGAGDDTLTGGLGDDTYVVDAAGDVVTENASEGTDTVQSSLSWTLGSNLENLVLTGSAAINGTGNSLNNAVTGNSGNNTLDGGAGDDTLTGGVGNDTYVVDTAGDVVAENALGGKDTVQSSVSYTLGSNLENLILTGSAAINGTGNSLNNTVTGNSGANTLDGGTGADTLTGGLGDDI